MPKKNKYHSLDDIGFIGTQEKRSKKQQEEDAKLTSEYIRKHKAANKSTSSKLSNPKPAATSKSA